MASYEEVFISENKICSIDTQQLISLGLHNIKLDDLKVLLLTKFYDHNIMNAIQCIFESLSVNTPINPALSWQISENLRHWVHLDKLVGAPSVFGLAMVGSINGRDNDFIFKINRPNEKLDPSVAKKALLHEYAVGVLVTNNLRQYDNGWSYVLGKFICGSPSFEDKTITSFCSETSLDRDYIIYERIIGKSWRETIRTSSSNHFLINFLKLLQTLHVGSTKAGLTHYDLHYDNVINRETEYHTSAFNIGSISGWLVSNTIPTIIDYGKAFYVFNNFGFGLNEPNNGIFMETRPLYDVYRILRASYIEADTAKRTDLLDVISALLNYFITDPAAISTSPIALMDSVKATQSIETYVNWLFNYIPGLHNLFKNVPMEIFSLNCAYKNNCNLTATDAFTELGIGTSLNTMNIQDIFDLERIYYTDPVYTTNFIIGNQQYIINILNVATEESKRHIVEASHIVKTTVYNTQDEYLKALDKYIVATGYLTIVKDTLNAMQRLIPVFGKDDTYINSGKVLQTTYEQTIQDTLPFLKRVKIDKPTLTSISKATGDMNLLSKIDTLSNFT